MQLKSSGDAIEKSNQIFKEEDQGNFGQDWMNNQDIKQYNDGSKNDGDGSNSVSSRNLKRYRRTAGEISRKYTCWCGKAYGSEGSLNQHKKLKKHFGENQDDLKDEPDNMNDMDGNNYMASGISARSVPQNFD